MEGYVLYCTERRVWNDVLATVSMICMVHLHAVKLLEFSRCQQQETLGMWTGLEFDYPCNGPLPSKALAAITNVYTLWQGILRLRGPEMYLLWCVCTILSWLVVAVASIHSSTIRRFYASGARVALLVGTKVVCKVASIVSLALWRDAPPSTFCKWYLPVDGAALLWQAHVAPVGPATQAMIAAADAACTFCCCWLLSDRWPYNFSTGTVLAMNLLLASASLWLAERMELSERRDYERDAIRKKGRDGVAALALEGADKKCLDLAAAKGKGPGWTSSGTADGVVCCSLSCGSISATAAASATSTRFGFVGRTAKAGSPEPTPPCAGPALQKPESPLQQRPCEVQCNLKSCSCVSGTFVARAGISRTSVAGNGVAEGGHVAAGAATTDGCCIGGSTSASSGGGMFCSEASYPAAFSSTRSFSRALPSFSTLSNCSAFGAGASCSPFSAGTLTETSGCLRSTSRPSSCIGGNLAGRVAGQQQAMQQATQPHTLTAVAMAVELERMGASCFDDIGAAVAPVAVPAGRAAPSASCPGAATPVNVAVHSMVAEADNRAPLLPDSHGPEVCQEEPPSRETGVNFQSGSLQSLPVMAQDDGIATASAAEGAAALAHAVAGPLRQLSRLVQNIMRRSGIGATASVALLPSANQQMALKRPGNRGTGVSDIAMALAPRSYCSSPSRSSVPRLCSYQSQDGAVDAAVIATTLYGHSSGTAAPEALERRADSEPPDTAAGAATFVGTAAAQGLGSIPTLVPTPHAGTAGEESRCQSEVAAPSLMLVSADSVLTHVQVPIIVPDGLLHLQQRQQRPQVQMGPSALSADIVLPARQNQAQPSGPAAVTMAAADTGGSSGTCAVGALSSGAISGVALATRKEAVITHAANASMPPAARVPQVPVHGAALGAVHYSGADGSIAAASLGPNQSSYSPSLRATPCDSRAVPCFAVARALAARGGSNAIYDAPALQHTRCSIKLEGLAPADLPYGFVGRVASLLTATGSSAMAGGGTGGHPGAATAALAAVGVYVREGCVEMVADVLVPSGAATAESLVVAAAANAAAIDPGTGNIGADAATRAQILDVADNSVTLLPAPPSGQQQTPAVPASLDHAAAEAMLNVLEQSLLPQIHEVLPPLAPIRGGYGLQATVGSAQVEAWHLPPLALATAAPPLPVFTPPPTIVCVAPCCASLSQSSSDDTRDCRRQTLTLTVALAGIDARDGGTRPPRVFVRHSGRCLAVVVRPCAVPYVSCLAVTVEVAISGIRPGLLFLEVAAAGGDAGDVALSLPWPVLIVGDARVAAEVMQMQQQLEATAPLRALRADSELLQFRQQGSSTPRRQQQLDSGTTSLLVDFGMWFEAVSMPDAVFIAAATGQPFVNSRHINPADLTHHDQPGQAMTAPPPQPLVQAQPLTGSLSPAGAVDENELEENGRKEAVKAGDEGTEEATLEEREQGSDDGSWTSSEDQCSVSGVDIIDAVAAGVDSPRSTSMRIPRHVGMRTPGRGDGCAGGSNPRDCTEAGGAASNANADPEGEVQLLLLRDLQPDQELLEGSLDCAAEYEQTCRQGPGLQAAAAGLGIRLLRFAVLRGWPAAATLLLKGLMIHCRLCFEDVCRLFPAANGLLHSGGGAGMPLLHTAVMSGSLTMVRAVKAWGQRYRCSMPWVEPVAAAGGLTPLHLAAVQDGGRLAGAILGLWPDAEAQWAVVRDRDGRTPQEYACMRAMSASSGASSSSAPASRKAPAIIAAPPAASPTVAPQHPQLVQEQQQPMRPDHAQEWWTNREIGTEGLVQQQQAQQAQQAQQQQLALAGVTLPSSGPYLVTIAPQARRPPPLLSPPLQVDCESSGGPATAAPHGEYSGSNASFMTTVVPGINCAGPMFTRLERMSDCGSMSMGPDSQWSHSTNATAQMQYTHLTRTLQDARGGLSPVRFAGVHHAVNAALLSLANLPDIGSNTSGGDGGCGGDVSSVENPSPAAGTEPFLSSGNELHRQLLALAAPTLQQQQLQQASDRHVRASFQLSLKDNKPLLSSELLPSQQLQQAHSLTTLWKPHLQLCENASCVQQMPPEPVQQVRPTPQRPLKEGQLHAVSRGLPGGLCGGACSSKGGGSLPSRGPLTGSSVCLAASMPLLGGGTAQAGTAGMEQMVADADNNTNAPVEAAAELPPPPNAISITKVHVGKAPQVQLQHRTLTPALPPTPSRLSSRGVRLLATTLLGESCISLRSTRTPPGSTGPPSSTVAVAASSSGAPESCSVTSAMGPSDGGRFSTRRVAFVDDYAPACQPTVAARTSRLTRLLPLLAAKRDAGANSKRAAALLRRQQCSTEQPVSRIVRTEHGTGEYNPDANAGGTGSYACGAGHSSYSGAAPAMCSRQQLDQGMIGVTPGLIAGAEVRLEDNSMTPPALHISSVYHQQQTQKQQDVSLPVPGEVCQMPSVAATPLMAPSGVGGTREIAIIPGMTVSAGAPRLFPISLLMVGLLVLVTAAVISPISRMLGFSLD
ncbi:hypothetical protein Vretifemale_11687 [Volvox reticuliferus]|uniref:Uncharacterized protein n=2 Tax=Volvox reticuliferus TaxID=1737510 RepID=A0A8J4FMT8_9CHLO|nr:hypothetical protein Vretifemale_11687 [Volvox reticuliferus]